MANGNIFRTGGAFSNCNISSRSYPVPDFLALPNTRKCYNNGRVTQYVIGFEYLRGLSRKIQFSRAWAAGVASTRRAYCTCTCTFLINRLNNYVPWPMGVVIFFQTNFKKKNEKKRKKNWKKERKKKRHTEIDRERQKNENKIFLKNLCLKIDLMIFILSPRIDVLTWRKKWKKNVDLNLIFNLEFVCSTIHEPAGYERIYSRWDCFHNRNSIWFVGAGIWKSLSTFNPSVEFLLRLPTKRFIFFF